MPSGGDLGRLGDQLGDREALDAGHRVDLLAHALAGDDEQRAGSGASARGSVSRTRPRRASVRRRRRMRVAGKGIRSDFREARDGEAPARTRGLSPL